jgi:hypothetical protein
LKIFGQISELTKLVFRLSSSKQVEVQSAEQTAATATITIPNVGATGVANLITDKDSGTVTSAMIATETIVDGDISPTAAIAGTKISPNFGSQAIATTGSLAAASATLSGLSTAGVVHNSAAGALSTSKIVNADVDDAAAITDGKLATISAAGKVSGSAITSGTIGGSTAVNTSGNIATSGTVSGGTLSGNLSASSISGATSVSYAENLAGAINGSGELSVSSTPVIYITSGSTLRGLTGFADGKQAILVNGTGSDIAVQNANPSTTGAGIRVAGLVAGDYTFKNDTAISLVYDGYQDAWYLTGAASAGGSAGGMVVTVTTASPHGFTAGDVGSPLYLNGSTYAKAKADAANTAEVVGIFSKYLTGSMFELTLAGEVTNASWSLTTGENYFLSAATAGAITSSEPSTIGQVSVPLGVAASATKLYFSPKRGVVVGGTNARTQLSLTSSASTQIFNALTPTLYQAGELTGWVQLGTSQKFYFRAPFAQNGAGTDWNVSPSYVGDTPPAGFSISMNSSGAISVTCPSFAGAGLVNYALNAPAVGATFPLEISASRITQDTIAAARLPVVVPGTSAGVVAAAGLPGNTTGSAIAAGYVGESFLLRTSTGVSIGTTGTSILSQSLGPGRWALDAGISIDTGANQICWMGFYTGTATSPISAAAEVNATAVSGNRIFMSNSWIVDLATTTTVGVYGQAQSGTINAAGQRCYFRIVRIA